MNIITHENSYFNISRINLSLINPNDYSILMKENQTNYFYIDGRYYLQYDILVFTSNFKNRIKVYHLSYPKILDYGFYNYVLCTSQYILNISTEPNENIYVNIKFLPKNILLDNGYNEQPEIKQIKLSFPNSGYNEIYYLRTKKEYINSYFLREISGKFKASYIYLEDVNNLDDVFPDDNNKMIPFNDNIINNDTKNSVLMHFESINNNPVIFEIIALYNGRFPIFTEGSFFFFYLENSIEKTISTLNPSSNNISIYLEYFGCNLDKDELINIKFGDNDNLVMLNKTMNKIVYNTIFDFNKIIIYSSKDCGILVKAGKKEINISAIEESYNNTLSGKELFFVYPKNEKELHYHIYFNDLYYSYYCSFNYDISDFTSISYGDDYIVDNYNI